MGKIKKVRLRYYAGPCDAATEYFDMKFMVIRDGIIPAVGDVIGITEIELDPPIERSVMSLETFKWFVSNEMKVVQRFFGEDGLTLTIKEFKVEDFYDPEDPNEEPVIPEEGNPANMFRVRTANQVLKDASLLPDNSITPRSIKFIGENKNQEIITWTNCFDAPIEEIILRMNSNGRWNGFRFTDIYINFEYEKQHFKIPINFKEMNLQKLID